MIQLYIRRLKSKKINLRKIQNRKSSQRIRKKKREKESEWKSQIKILTKENNTLKSENLKVDNYINVIIIS